MTDHPTQVRNARSLVDISRIVKSAPVDDDIRRELRETRALLAACGRFMSAFDEYLADKETEDKLTAFEIQDLMSRYNEAESLAEEILKKRDCMANTIIGKV